MNNTDSRGLVERFRRGDWTAFEEIVAGYQDRVFTQCYHLTGNYADAQDLAQEVFVRAFRGLASFRGDAELGTWLHRIAVNLFLNWRKGRRTAATVVSIDETRDTGEGVLQWQLAGDCEDPTEVMDREQRRQLVREAIARLPRDFRAVLILRDMEGHSYEDIAQILGCSLGTVKSRLNRARKALRDTYAELSSQAGLAPWE